MPEMASLAVLADVAIVTVAVEAIALVVYRWRTGKGIATARLLPNLGAGLLLMLGIRVSLSGAGWPWLPLCLLAAGAVHLVDMRMRWNRA